MRTIGQNIKYFRKLRKYSQEKLAELADVSVKSISFYETDKRNIPTLSLIAIAEALNVTLDELCGVRQPEPESELEREIAQAIMNVLRGFEIRRLDNTQRVDNATQHMDEEKIVK